MPNIGIGNGTWIGRRFPRAPGLDEDIAAQLEEILAAYSAGEAVEVEPAQQSPMLGAYSAGGIIEAEGAETEDAAATYDGSVTEDEGAQTEELVGP